MRLSMQYGAGFVVGSMIAFAIAMVVLPMMADDNRPLCFQTEGPDLEGYTPAHLVEKDIVGHMVYRVAPTLRCRGFIDGRFVELDADQVWIARSPAAELPRETQ